VDDRNVNERNATGAHGAAWLAAGLAGGFAVGLFAWSAQMRRSQRDLFSRFPLRRYAALGVVGSRPTVETWRLLCDYVRWERQPALRRRGEAVLRRVELYLK
jgi:hypothetical protein